MSNANDTGKANREPEALDLIWPCRVPWCIGRRRDERRAYPGARERVLRYYLRTRTGQWCSKHLAAARAAGFVLPKEPAEKPQA